MYSFSSGHINFPCKEEDESSKDTRLCSHLEQEREALVEGEKEISLAGIFNSKDLSGFFSSATMLQVWSLHTVERDKAVCI